MWNDRKKMGVISHQPTWRNLCLAAVCSWPEDVYGICPVLSLKLCYHLSLSAKKQQVFTKFGKQRAKKKKKKRFFLIGIKIIISRYNPHSLQLNFILHTSHCGVLSWLQGFSQYLKKKKKCTTMTGNLKNRRWAGGQKHLTAHLAGHISNTKQWDTPQSTDLQLDPLSHEVKVLLHEPIDKQHQFPQGHSVQTFTASKGEYSVHLSIHPNMYWTLNHEEQCMYTPKLCGHWPYHFLTAVKAGGSWSE